MGIEDEDIERVRQATDIVQIVTQYTQLRRVGRRWQGLCPFHSERSPSFSVNAEQGLYHCFGCGKSGDTITFVREKEGLDFVGAIEFLAAKSGITLRYTDRDQGEGRKRRNRLVEAVATAVEWYHQRLLSAPDGREARTYLKSRGIDGEVARRFKIGWAPEDAKHWDLLCREVKLSDKDLRESGLGNVNSRGRQYDMFRGRILFPIFDERGDPIGFGGRIMPGREGPKYKNTSDDAVIYAKSRVLYGLNWAKEDIVASGEAIICEGYTDVIGFFAAGLPRAVATCGTALTEDHIKLLTRFTNRLVLAFDADSAGQNAAARVYEWEQKYAVDVAVAALPAGVDPADLARTDPDGLAAAVRGAVPFLEFRVRRALDAGNLSTAEGRVRTAEAALTMVREHPNGLVRDQYLMQIADRCRIEPQQLRELLRSAPGASRGIVVAEDRPERPAGAGRVDTAEDEALRLLVHRRDEIADRLDEVLFDAPTRAEAYRLLAEHADLHTAIALADDAEADLLRRVAVEESDADPAQVVADLTRYATQRVLDRLRLN